MGIQLLRWRGGTLGVCVSLATPACAPSARIVSLSPGAAKEAPVPSGDRIRALEIVSGATTVPDPLPVRGSDVAYSGLERALGASLAWATAPWAEAREADPARNKPLSLVVDVTHADARLEGGGRLLVEVDVRATLRTRSGNVYLGQTQAGCSEGDLASPDQGAHIIVRCLATVGHDLAGWLAGGVPLDPPADGP